MRRRILLAIALGAAAPAIGCLLTAPSRDELAGGPKPTGATGGASSSATNSVATTSTGGGAGSIQIVHHYEIGGYKQQLDFKNAENASFVTPAEGNLLLVAISGNNTQPTEADAGIGVVVDAAGFKKITGDMTDGNAARLELRVRYKVATGQEPDVDFPIMGSLYSAATLIEVSGVDPLQPFTGDIAAMSGGGGSVAVHLKANAARAPFVFLATTAHTAVTESGWLDPVHEHSFPIDTNHQSQGESQTSLHVFEKSVDQSADDFDATMKTTDNQQLDAKQSWVALAVGLKPAP